MDRDLSLTKLSWVYSVPIDLTCIGNLDLISILQSIYTPTLRKYIGLLCTFLFYVFILYDINCLEKYDKDN